MGKDSTSPEARARYNPLGVYAFQSILDEKTGKARTREVDVDSDSYKLARHYMIRLDASDFQSRESVAALAVVGRMTPEEFEKRFRYLVSDPPVRRAMAR